jgi:hypothetical protein
MSSSDQPSLPRSASTSQEDGELGVPLPPPAADAANGGFGVEQFSPPKEEPVETSGPGSSKSDRSATRTASFAGAFSGVRKLRKDEEREGVSSDDVLSAGACFQMRSCLFGRPPLVMFPHRSLSKKKHSINPHTTPFLCRGP